MSEEKEEIEGFRIETFVDGSCYASCSRSRHGVAINVEVSDGTLTVEGEQGSGYCREQVTCRVPLAVVARLLRAAGWTVPVPVVA